MEKLAYCPDCGAAVRFETRQRKRVTELDGKRYAYAVKQAVCERCGAEATYPPYQEEAGLAFNEAVRLDLGIVSLEVIEEIPKRYGIGKRPLSRVLGWGEHTYSQLMNGQTPSKVHSDLLAQIAADPLCYRSLLIKRRQLISDRAYARSLEAVDAYLANSYPEAARIYELGRCFFNLAHGDITSMAIQKLVYYAQGFSKHFFGSFIVKQMPRAWADGPVYGQLWYRFKNDPESYFASDEEADCSSVFTPCEDELIQAIYDAFGCYSGDVLSAMTHREAPWLLARKRAGALPGEKCEEPISEADMDAFFSGVAQRYGMSCYRDVGLYAEAAFGERYSLYAIAF